MSIFRANAPAKLNLYLQVLGRRAHGYHILDSLMVFADVGEYIALDTQQTGSLSIIGPRAKDLIGVSASDDDNLVVRAKTAFEQYVGRPCHGQITLNKTMPVASGIGGGSADAAAALRALRDAYAPDMPLETLAKIGGALGSDVPVCVYSSTQHLLGTGPELKPARYSGPQHLVLANPMQAVSTAQIFKTLNAALETELAQMSQTRKSSYTLADVAQMKNDLERPAISQCPAIKDVLSALAAQPGAQLARMSGSGATCFALFRTENEAKNAVKHVSMQNPNWWVTQTETIL